MDLKPDMKVCLLFTFVHLLPIILTVRVREPRAVDIRSDFRCFVVRIQSVVGQRKKKKHLKFRTMTYTVYAPAAQVN